MNLFQETFRWFGPTDPVPLRDIAQTGATGIVSALHDIYDGSVWPLDKILEHKALIEKAGLKWTVAESIPVHNSIKTASAERDAYIDRYKTSMRNLAEAGVNVLCYNFMPVVDWTRTSLHYPLDNGAVALRFEAADFAAYDVFILKRKNADASYDSNLLARAEERYKALTEADFLKIEANLIAGLPATERQFTRGSFLEALDEYSDIDSDTLHDHLAYFLREIVPVAEENGMRIGIHPDDPSFSLYGLPRIVSSAEDVRKILNAVDTPANGLTFCSGSFGTNRHNNLPAMIEEFASRINFCHFRSVHLEDDNSFHESDHLVGNANIPLLAYKLLDEQARRKSEGREDWQIPMRPDHGHLLADDIGKKGSFPGYSLIGRLKGLAEIRGISHAYNIDHQI